MLYNFFDTKVQNVGVTSVKSHGNTPYIGVNNADFLWNWHLNAILHLFRELASVVGLVEAAREEYDGDLVRRPDLLPLVKHVRQETFDGFLEVQIAWKVAKHCQVLILFNILVGCCKFLSKYCWYCQVSSGIVKAQKSILMIWFLTVISFPSTSLPWYQIISIGHCIGSYWKVYV